MEYQFNALRGNIQYMSLNYQKKDFTDKFKLEARMAEDLKMVIDNTLCYFLEFDELIVYYDNESMTDMRCSLN